MLSLSMVRMLVRVRSARFTLEVKTAPSEALVHSHKKAPELATVQFKSTFETTSSAPKRTTWLDPERNVISLSTSVGPGNHVRKRW